MALEERWAVPLPDAIVDAPNDATTSVGGGLCQAAENLRAVAASSVGGLWPSAWPQPGTPPWPAPSASPWETAQAASWVGLAVLALVVLLRLLIGPGIAVRVPARGPRPPAARARPGPRERDEEGGVSAPRRTTEPA